MSKFLKYLIEETDKEKYFKVLKVIRSVETPEQAEVAYKMIKNFSKLVSQDKSISGSFGMKSVFDVMKKEKDLIKFLRQVARKNRDNEFIDWLNSGTNLKEDKKESHYIIGQTTKRKGVEVDLFYTDSGWTQDRSKAKKFSSDNEIDAAFRDMPRKIEKNCWTEEVYE